MDNILFSRDSSSVKGLFLFTRNEAFKLPAIMYVCRCHFNTSYNSAFVRAYMHLVAVSRLAALYRPPCLGVWLKVNLAILVRALLPPLPFPSSSLPAEFMPLSSLPSLGLNDGCIYKRTFLDQDVKVFKLSVKERKKALQVVLVLKVSA